MANISKFNMDGKNINVVDAEARAKAEQATGNIEKVTEDLQAETERAQNAETANTTLIQNETSRAEGAESSINNKLEEETSRAKEAEQANAEGVESNAGKIADETTRAENAESNLQTSITNETTRAEQEERTNRNNINDLRENKVDNVSVTNENGIYTLTQTKNGNQTEIGTINTNGSSSSNNPVVEVKDSIVEDNDNGYDYHTLSETTEDGTENNIGHLYVAQNQITGIKKSPSGLTVSHVDQSGYKSSEDISLDGQGESTNNCYYQWAYIKVHLDENTPIDKDHPLKLQLERSEELYNLLNDLYSGINTAEKNAYNSNYSNLMVDNTRVISLTLSSINYGDNLLIELTSDREDTGETITAGDYYIVFGPQEVKINKYPHEINTTVLKN